MATFGTRIKNKRDTESNWTANDPVLLNGELVIVDVSDGSIGVKIGDGTKAYSELTFYELVETSEGGSNAADFCLVPETFELEDLTIKQGSCVNLSSDWATVQFDDPFTEAIPYVGAQIDGYEVEIKNVSLTGFEYRVYEVEEPSLEIASSPFSTSFSTYTNSYDSTTISYMSGISLKSGAITLNSGGRSYISTSSNVYWFAVAYEGD